MSKRDAEICRDAAVILHRKGLNKGDFVGENGSVCLWGALRMAYAQRSVLLAHIDASNVRVISRAIRARFPDEAIGEYPGARYNDAPSTTAEDVEKLLLQIADEVELL